MKKNLTIKVFMLSSLIAVSGCSTSNTEKFSSKNKKFNESYTNIVLNLDESQRNKLDASMNYLLIRKLFNEDKLNLSNAFVELYDANKLKAEMFAGKKPSEIIQQAEKLAKEDKTQKLNTNNYKDFVYSYYSLLVADYNANVPSLYYTLLMSNIFSLSNVKVDNLQKDKNSLTEKELASIQQNMLENYIKNRNFEKLSDLDTSEDYKNKIDRKRSFIKELNKKEVSKQEQVVELQSMIKRLELALEEKKYSSNALYKECNTQNMKYENFRINDTSLDKLGAKTFTFDAVNKDSNMKSLHGEIILNDKDNNYFVSKINKDFEKNAVKDVVYQYRININEEDFKYTKISELSMNRIIFDRCDNKGQKDYSEDDLKDLIKYFKVKLETIETRPA